MCCNTSISLLKKTNRRGRQLEELTRESFKVSRRRCSPPKLILPLFPIRREDFPVLSTYSWLPSPVHPTSTSRSSANPTAPPSQHIGTPTTSRHLHLHHLGPWTHKAAPNCPLCCHLCLSRVSMPHGNWFKPSLVSSLLKTPQWLLFANRTNAQVLPRVLCDLVPLTIQP